MSVGATLPSRGAVGVVSAGDGVSQKRTRSLVDEDNLSPEAKAALDADDFIVYGKASVEQYDEDWPPQKLEMESFEEKMEQFFDPGLISRRHKDIPVGKALREHKLEEDTTIQVGEEALSFEAGDVLRTGIRDDELWIVANIRNDSEIARETRLGVLNGDLDGFSVTVFCKEWEETPKGQRVTDFDWHSTTIGSDEQIKNKPSRFGLAEYKGEFAELFGEVGPSDPDAAAKAAVELLGAMQTTMGANTQESPEDTKGFWRRVRDVASQKAEEDGDYDEENSEEAKSEETGQEGDVVVEEEADDSAVSDVSDVIGKAVDDLSEKEFEVLKQAVLDEEDYEEEPEEGDLGTEEDLGLEDEEEQMELKEDDDGDEEEYDYEEDMKALQERLTSVEEKLDAFATTEDVKAALPDLPEGEVATKEDVEAVMKAAEDVLTEDVPSLIESSVSTKASFGETPDPGAGTTQDERDYMSEIKQKFGSKGGGG